MKKLKVLLLAFTLLLVGCNSMVKRTPERWIMLEIAQHYSERDVQDTYYSFEATSLMASDFIYDKNTYAYLVEVSIYRDEVFWEDFWLGVIRVKEKSFFEVFFNIAHYKESDILELTITEASKDVWSNDYEE
ncbi:MAG: hypothetical protein M0P09_02560 [Acholeplasmataceae bacterium]|nr:hypothetical protein [Acholeplasmataceae bacterium]